MPNPTPSFAGNAVLVALGGAIRSLRKEQGISQESLAHDSGVERAYMSGIERGVQNVTVMTLSKIAAALKVSLADVFHVAGK